MNSLFVHNNENTCCLCSSTKYLTGEHKIKSSAIKAEFRNELMLFGKRGLSAKPMKYAQSPKSTTFHFKSRLCADCNRSRTQTADREFDHLNSVARALFDNGKHPRLALNEPRYEEGSTAYLNVFRYFAKLLCCHIADAGGPRSISLSHFATGLSDFNCIWLDVDEDMTYKQWSEIAGEHQYAAHGGLLVSLEEETGIPTGFHSSLTIGPLQYLFSAHLHWLGSQALIHLHPSFCARLRDLPTLPASDDRSA